jgi:hypothetical protein
VAWVALLEVVPEVEPVVWPVLVTTVKVVAVPSVLLELVGTVVIVVSVVEPVVLVVPVLVVVSIVPFVLVELCVEPVLCVVVLPVDCVTAVPELE